MTLRLPRNRFLRFRSPVVLGTFVRGIRYEQFQASIRVIDGKRCIVVPYATDRGV